MDWVNWEEKDLIVFRGLIANRHSLENRCSPPKIMKSFTKILFGTLLAVAVANLTLQAQSQSTNKPAPTTKAAEKKAPADKKESNSKNQPTIPFRGHLLEVNKAAKTIKVDKRIFEVAPETKISLKGERPAKLEEGVIGQYVTGSYKKSEDGKLIAHSIYFGGKEKKKSYKEKAPEKSSGK
jgi:hypothetical protein